MTTQDSPPGFGWLVPMVAVSLLPSTLSRAGLGSAAWGQVVSLVVGLAAGVFWYWYYPRPLADRLAPAVTLFGSIFLIVAVASAVLSGGDAGPTFDGSDAPELIGWIGVVCALVLSERWQGRRGAGTRSKELTAHVDPG